MADGNLLGGYVTLKYNGRGLHCEGEFKYGGIGRLRTAQRGTNYVVGYTAEPQVPFIEGNIYLKDVTLDDIIKIKDATITLELENGKIFTLYNAWTVNDKGGEVSTKDSKTPIKFEGIRGMEVKTN